MGRVMCQCLPSTRYLNDQVFCHLFSIYCNDLDLCHVLISGVLRGEWLLTVMVITKMKKCLRVMPPSKLSRSTLCLMI
jgi:hypothetical protein